MKLNDVQYWSHPNKPLEKHINGVIENAKKLTEGFSVQKWAELMAIFHDLGKINPNFQEKLKPIPKPKGYANHAYLSAYAFFAFCFNPKNNALLKTFLNSEISSNDFISWILVIAKHHGNIPNFDTPDGFGGGSYHPLNAGEINNLFAFINSTALPISEYTREFPAFSVSENFEDKFLDNKIQSAFLDASKFRFKPRNNTQALHFYLDTQFAFASLIQADKTDAAKFENLIDDNKADVAQFCATYQSQLKNYLSKLNQDSELNKLRTEIRLDAVDKICIGLQQKKRVFELTSPTGSGKTLMLLSLASEIMNVEQKNLRVIYALPFLSITEQVEAEVLNIFKESKDFVQRIDSKSENARFEKIQEELDNNPSDELLREINLLGFVENTFAYPFVITTFVRFFETLLSNRNAELLKLPNFANCIFLIDEIQSLPPRLYGFFVAYLTKFCEKFNSYAIVSTATQPNFELPTSHSGCNKCYVKTPADFFPSYAAPYPLLSLDYFQKALFNRYVIYYDKTDLDINTLKEKIIAENHSVLVILNTIDDTKDLYNQFIESGVSKKEILLLNTHFTPKHRKLKIYLAKRKLRAGKRIILISTQLIEAGVDIDFPVLYRDFATIPSIIQSAGRCNRNGKLNLKGELGKVNLIRLAKNGKLRADLIYRGLDKEFLNFTREEFKNTEYQENTLIEVQQSFFNRIKNDLNFAVHKQKKYDKNFNFLKDIQECQFEKIGKFQLIDEDEYGVQTQYFVPHNDDDIQFERLLELKFDLDEAIKNHSNPSILRLKKQQIERHLKKMSVQIVQVRLKSGHQKPILGNSKSYFETLFKISLDSYSFDKGIHLSGEENTF